MDIIDLSSFYDLLPVLAFLGARIAKRKSCIYLHGGNRYRRRAVREPAINAAALRRGEDISPFSSEVGFCWIGGRALDKSRRVKSAYETRWLAARHHGDSG
jgi:hypothetical protein